MYVDNNKWWIWYAIKWGSAKILHNILNLAWYATSMLAALHALKVRCQLYFRERQQRSIKLWYFGTIDDVMSWHDIMSYILKLRYPRPVWLSSNLLVNVRSSIKDLCGIKKYISFFSLLNRFLLSNFCSCHNGKSNLRIKPVILSIATFDLFFRHTQEKLYLQILINKFSCSFHTYKLSAYVCKYVAACCTWRDAGSSIRPLEDSNFNNLGHIWSSFLFWDVCRCLQSSEQYINTYPLAVSTSHLIAHAYADGLVCAWSLRCRDKIVVYKNTKSYGEMSGFTVQAWFSIYLLREVSLVMTWCYGKELSLISGQRRNLHWSAQQRQCRKIQTHTLLYLILHVPGGGVKWSSPWFCGTHDCRSADQLQEYLAHMCTLVHNLGSSHLFHCYSCHQGTHTKTSTLINCHHALHTLYTCVLDPLKLGWLSDLNPNWQLIQVLPMILYNKFQACTKVTLLPCCMHSMSLETVMTLQRFVICLRSWKHVCMVSIKLYTYGWPMQEAHVSSISSCRRVA